MSILLSSCAQTEISAYSSNEKECMGERREGSHFKQLSDIQKRAVDDHIRAVLTDEAEIDFTRKREPSCGIIHPDEYRDSMREFFASNSLDVQEIEQRYEQKLRENSGIKRQSSGPRGHAQ